MSVYDQLSSAKLKCGKKPKPGDILFDRTGKVSHCNPTTYVVLSADPSETDSTRMAWKLAEFCGDGTSSIGWAGASIKEFWWEDFKHLEYVGRISHNKISDE